jgi:mono/diheme cytochrome c family protein
MNRRALAPAALACTILVLAVSERTSAQDASLVAQGRTTFHEKCEPCHGSGPGNDGAAALPGTAALALKYKGKISPLLEQRDDLKAEVLKFFLRKGTGSMPMFRKTEVSDYEITVIAAYFVQSAKKNPYFPEPARQKNADESR